eukprot:TRINITY_DN26090_c0_g1_i1.p1 TRINITY_DN26090_c0_g1~~TRINITY_DN26090_c0_g1_i1.p1  ORF type:complete len:105 (+),score=0.59 TRINITY_DN26090_c0_g1_i1:110-424(+)
MIVYVEGTEYIIVISFISVPKTKISNNSMNPMLFLFFYIKYRDAYLRKGRIAGVRQCRGRRVSRFGGFLREGKRDWESGFFELGKGRWGLGQTSLRALMGFFQF